MEVLDVWPFVPVLITFPLSIGIMNQRLDSFRKGGKDLYLAQSLISQCQVHGFGFFNIS